VPTGVHVILEYCEMKGRFATSQIKGRSGFGDLRRGVFSEFL
jgi:hypothetical protein